MKEIFEDFVPILEFIAFLVICSVLFISSPVWFVPFLIYKHYTEE